jgi:hypothetical protein
LNEIHASLARAWNIERFEFKIQTIFIFLKPHRLALGL